MTTDIELGKVRYSSVNEGTVIPMSEESHKGTVLRWSNVSYTVPLKDASPSSKESNKMILNNISGVAYPGELTAIMGTSGAGKSSLLDVLSGRLDARGLTGQITLNGAPMQKTLFRRESAYVFQNDHLFPLLTVRETFQFAAYLRVPNKTREEQNRIASSTIALLRLESCADTIIGNDLVRGISGGEKRRVSIGQDIVNQPKVIFLDEPTSGLDSGTAYSVMSSLKDLATTKNSTIVMTIHQPSARLFELFDKVTFLANGQTTFFGPAKDLQFFTEKVYKEINLPLTIQANPPELFLDLSDSLKAQDKLSILTSKFMVTSDKVASTIAEEASATTYANSIVGDVLVLCERSLLNIVRTKELFFIRLGGAIFFAILGGTLFLNTKDDDAGIQHRVAFFVLTLAYFYWNSLEALPIFFAEREIFEREYSSGAYRGLSYTISSSIVYYPFLFLLAVVYVFVGWWLVGLPNDGQIVLFEVLIVFIVLIAGSSFATMLSTLAPDPMTGQSVGSAILAVFFVFSGYFIKRPDIPDYWIYFHYASLFKFALDSQVINGIPADVSTPDQTHSEILKSFGVDGISKWTGFGVLIGWIIFYRAVFYYRLLTAFNGSRKK